MALHFVLLVPTSSAATGSPMTGSFSLGEETGVIAKNGILTAALNARCSSGFYHETSRQQERLDTGGNEEVVKLSACLLNNCRDNTHSLTALFVSFPSRWMERGQWPLHALLCSVVSDFTPEDTETSGRNCIGVLGLRDGVSGRKGRVAKGAFATCI